MRAVAKSKKFAKKVGVSQSVGAKFMKADKKKKRRVRKYQTGRLVDAGDIGAEMDRDNYDAPAIDSLRQGLGSMGAVEGATDVRLGARGARPRPRTPPMGFSPRSRLPTIGASEGPARRRPTPRELRMDEVRNRPMGFRGEEFDVERVKPRKKKKKKASPRNLYAGGKIRGCGKAIRGRKKAKRIVMKGS